MKRSFRKDSLKEKFHLNEEFNQRFNNIANRYEQVTFGASIGTKFVNKKEEEIVIELLKNYFNFPDKKKVLDIGAGNGRWSKLFLSLGCEVSALDISSEMCRVLSKIEKLHVFQGDIQQLILNEKFDLVFTMRALKYTDLRKALENITHVLNNNGFVIFELPYRYNPFYFLFNLLSFILIRISKHDSHINYILTINLYGKSETERIISKFKYRILETKKEFFFPDFLYSKIRSKTFLRFSTIVESIFSKVLPRSLIYVIQKESSSLPEY
jgi:SAM-dependent methyltransferase